MKFFPILCVVAGVRGLFEVISWQLARTPEEREAPHEPWLAWSG